MSTGSIALIVFLGSLLMGFICLVVIVYSGLRIYRTARYAYKDSQPWVALFKEYMENLQATAGIMEERVQGINATGQEIRENVDDIHDALDEMNIHPILHTAQFIGRFRR